MGYDETFIKAKLSNQIDTLHEQMKLDIGRRSACFYSYVTYQADSLVAAEMAKGSNHYEYKSGQITTTTYTDYPAAGQYSMTECLGMDQFLFQEDMPTIDWELCPDSTCTVLGYSCHKAVATVLGRQWSAWYAEDLPMDNGPWLLRGLPGLILRAYTADGAFRFEANGIERGDGKRAIYYKGDKCEKISRKSLASVYQRYFADPIGYIMGGGNVKVTVKDETGNEMNAIKDMKYYLLDKTLEK